MMSEKTFNQIAQEYLNEEVEIVTLQGNFSGRMLSVSQDTIILENRMRGRPLKVMIRIETIVALYRLNIMPRGFFDFPMENELEQTQTESSSHLNH